MHNSHKFMHINFVFNIGEQMVLAGHRVMTELHLYEYMDMAAVYLVQHPVMALFALAVALCCGIPILMFIIFAVLSVILTFTGFIVIEGLYSSL